MTLNEALALVPLDSARVVAGATHLDREVTWVQVVDHPDIEAWVERGHLLLSTGFNWPKTGATAAHLVEKLAAKGAAGVVLAVPHYVEHFPQESIEAAERCGLALIEVPWEIPFRAITQVAHREIIDSQGRALARSEQIHRQLTEAAVAGDGLQDVAVVLGGVLSRCVQIYSTEGVRLADFVVPEIGLASPSFLSGALVALEAVGGLKAMDAQTRAIRWQPRPSRLATKAQSIVGCAIRSRTERLGYVLVAEGAPPLNEIDLRAVEHAGTVAALQISHQRQMAAQEARLGYALVASLIEGRFDEKPGSLERARLAGWDENAQYRLAAVLMDEPNPLSSEGFARREVIANKVRRAMKLKGTPALISMSANQVHSLVPGSVPVEWLWAELAAGRAAMGVSEVHKGVEGMKLAGREVADLMEHVRPGRIHHFSEAVFPRVLAGDPAAQKIFLDRLFGAIGSDKRGEHLIETAIALADEGFNLQRASQRIDIHISTLRYRLAKLAEVTGLALDTVEGRFQLQLGVRLYVAKLD
ncbi:PucR family transcriptional regulator [Variovorax humicola]|uniref:PucR family transcriptional regulator n=1 Tax=Variovorax humicola TaxID=1769758 RepID=A0ABU8VXD3_9BURK